jgi:hypothetical protein
MVRGVALFALTGHHLVDRRSDLLRNPFGRPGDVGGRLVEGGKRALWLAWVA